MIRLTSALTLLFYLISFSISAQLPETEVFLLELKDNEDIKKVSLLTAFNPNTYNNQAVFISPMEVLLTSALEDNQTDIVKLNLQAKTWKRLTKTVESEYSPKLSNEANFTCVRVEQDEATQTLWEYPLNMSYTGEQALKNTGQVGYYQALPNLKMALFVIEETMNLYISNMRSDRKVLIDKNIGRCFQESKKGELIYIKKNISQESAQIKVYNTINEGQRTLAPALKDSEDFCLYGDQEKLIMAKGAQLFVYDSDSSTWLLWKDLADYGLLNITRLDTNGTKLLIVNNK